MVFPFLGVSTCSVWFLLSISRTQLFKTVINSIWVLLEFIQVVMLFIILLGQFNYFFSKTFKLIIHIMTIWKVVFPNILQVFIEVKNHVMSHVWPNCILSHYITISSFHRLGFVLLFCHCTITPSHYPTTVSLSNIYKLTLITCLFFHVVLWLFLPMFSKYLN